MNRKKLALTLGSIIGVLAAIGVLVWHFWPEPPPSTADQVYGAVMAADNPAEMSEDELAGWIGHVAVTVERLPPHEMHKLLTLALQNETLRQRFESLEPETRRKLVNLISEEQRARLGAEMAQGMVSFLKAMPKPLRDRAIREMHKRHKRQAAGRRASGERGHGHSKERITEWLGATPARRRAQLIRAFRDMRKMLEEAGVED